MYKSEELEQVKQGAIYLYKTGKLTDIEFATQMNKAFNTNLSVETFKTCWEAMCTMDEQTLNSIRELEKLQNVHDFGIHVMGGTNKMHVDYIKNQLRDLKITLNFSHTFSFETGTLEQEAPNANQEQWKESTIVDLRDKADIFVEINNAFKQNNNNVNH